MQTLIVVAVLLLAACSSSPTTSTTTDVPSADTAARACIPGAQVACACIGGGAGVQVCGPDGMEFTACLCPDAGGLLDAAVVDAGTDVAVDRGAMSIDAPDGDDAATPTDDGVIRPDRTAPIDDAGNILCGLGAGQACSTQEMCDRCAPRDGTFHWCCISLHGEPPACVGTNQPMCPAR